MSNFRINFGIGPLRYNAPIGGNKKGQSILPGCLILLVLMLILCCCIGALA